MNCLTVATSPRCSRSNYSLGAKPADHLPRQQRTHHRYSNPQQQRHHDVPRHQRTHHRYGFRSAEMIGASRPRRSSCRTYKVGLTTYGKCNRSGETTLAV